MVNIDGGEHDTGSYPSKDAACEKEADLYSRSLEDGSNKPNDCSDLNRPLATKSVRECADEKETNEEACEVNGPNGSVY